MPEVCAVCEQEIEEDAPVGVGTMLFHTACVPSCQFCTRAYVVEEAGWDFRGGTAWSDDWGYVQAVQAVTCPTCADDAQRRDYGAGW